MVANGANNAGRNPPPCCCISRRLLDMDNLLFAIRRSLSLYFLRRTFSRGVSRTVPLRMLCAHLFITVSIVFEVNPSFCLHQFPYFTHVICINFLILPMSCINFLILPMSYASISLFYPCHMHHYPHSPHLHIKLHAVSFAAPLPLLFSKSALDIVFNAS